MTDTEEMSGVDVKHYSTCSKVFGGGMTRKEVRDYYEEWSEAYDKQSLELYLGPLYVGEVCCDVIPEDKRSDSFVLDVAAGTGFLGQELHRRGFRQIHALDPSGAMLDIAKSKKVYNKFIEEFVTEEELPIQEGTYDCVVSSGGMGQGHVPTEALWEMVRITKTGGLICIAMREEYLREPDYEGKLEPLMDAIEERKKWTKINRDIIPNYFHDKLGVMYSYIKL